jgi:hypothetical protein
MPVVVAKKNEVYVDVFEKLTVIPLKYHRYSSMLEDILLTLLLMAASN